MFEYPIRKPQYIFQMERAIRCKFELERFKFCVFILLNEKSIGVLFIRVLSHDPQNENLKIVWTGRNSFGEVRIIATTTHILFQKVAVAMLTFSILHFKMVLRVRCHKWLSCRPHKFIKTFNSLVSS